MSQNVLSSSLLEVKNLYKRFEFRHVLKNLSFHLEKSQRLFLIGENGAGKTTLFSLLTGRLKADQGEVAITGSRLSKTSFQARRKVGLITHEPLLHEALEVHESLLWFAQALGIAHPKDRVNELLELFNLKTHAKSCLGKLSRGQKQKLALARAFLSNPSLLLLDEPFTGLDEQSRQDLLELLQELKQDQGMILTTHQTQLGLESCTHLAFLEKGAISPIVGIQDQNATTKLLEKFGKPHYQKVYREYAAAALF